LLDGEIICQESNYTAYGCLVNYFLSYYVVMSAMEPQLDAWRAIVTSHAAVTERVQRALAAADLPPLSWFELLSAVKRSPTGRPRMSDLAEWLTLSRGGITKLVDRLQEAGCLQRVSCPEDRRSLQAELTPAGETMLEEMRGVYEAELERHLRALTPKQAELIATALLKVTSSTCDAAHPDTSTQECDAGREP
jgi:DNA-binding MarR family transcriptional regulator